MFLLLFQVKISQVNDKACVGHQPASEADKTMQKEGPSAVISAAPSALDGAHMCQHCSAAFIQFNSLKVHMASCRGETVQTESSEPSPGQECGVSDHDDSSVEGNADKSGRRQVCDVYDQALSLIHI